MFAVKQVSHMYAVREKYYILVIYEIENGNYVHLNGCNAVCGKCWRELEGIEVK